jgi:DNA-binding CsgD family transcriptional regulator
MIGVEKFSALLASVYAAGLDPAKWPMLAQLTAETFQSGSASLQLRVLVPGGATSVVSVTGNITAQSCIDYEAYYCARDIYVQHAAAHGMNGAFLSQNAVLPVEAARTEFYSDWGRRSGIFHIAGGGTMTGPASAALLAIHRPEGAALFDEDDRNSLALVLPHVGRALQISGLLGGLQDSERARATGLDRLGVVAIVVAGNGVILWQNSAASRLFADGAAVQSVNGRLTARRKPEVLARLLQECAAPATLATPPSRLLSLQRSGRAPLSLLAGPLQASSPFAVGGIPAAIVFIHDPEVPSLPSESALIALHGLTPAEARLAAALAGGERLDAYAERNAISLATVKTHLRQVLAKTGTERQADMMVLLARDSILRLAGMPG